MSQSQGNLEVPSLPPEIWLLILNLIDPSDVVHFEQTCRDFRGIVDTSASTIWRNQLLRLCQLNGLFWPSYSHLSEASEFKTAAFAGTRFTNSYNRALSRTSSNIGCRRRIPQSLLEVFGRGTDAEGIPEMFFVPGGRFIMIFKRRSLLVMDSAHATPSVSFEMALPPGGFASIRYMNVVDRDVVQILYQFYYSSSLPLVWEQSPDRHLTVYGFLELSMTEDRSLAAKYHGHLALVHKTNRHPEALTVSGSNVFLLLEDITVAWNYKTNQYSVWKIEGFDAPAVEIFCNDHFVMYITGKGVYGVPLPDFRSTDTGYVSVDSPMEVAVPAFHIPQTHAHGIRQFDYHFPSSYGLVVSNISKPIDGTDSLIYHVRETIDSPVSANPGRENTSAVLLHQYRFSFDVVDLSKSTLNFLGTLKCLYSPPQGSSHGRSIGEFYANFYYNCAPSFGIVWRDLRSSVSLISVLPQLRKRHVEGELEVRLVPWITEDQTIKQDKSIVDLCFCPGSGTAAVLWLGGDDIDRVYLELFEFV